MYAALVPFSRVCPGPPGQREAGVPSCHPPSTHRTFPGTPTLHCTTASAVPTVRSTLLPPPSRPACIIYLCLPSPSPSPSPPAVDLAPRSCCGCSRAVDAIATSGPPSSTKAVPRPQHHRAKGLHPPTTTARSAVNMPFRSERPVVRVLPGSMHTIETRNPENLFGLWSVFSRCSPAMEDGKRYENMAWRLWGRETFCCAPDHIIPPRWTFGRRLSSSETTIPELSTSVASDDSHTESAITSTSRSNSSSSRPGFRRTDSTDSRAQRKHITPIDLEKVVNSIQEKRDIGPLSPLPAQLSQTLPIHTKLPVEDTTPQPSSPPPTTNVRYVPESSSSTVATALGSEAMSPPIGSDTTTSTELSAHSIVHGFEPGRISTSMRSSTNLAPTPILKTSMHSKPAPTLAEPAKKKQPMFMLGGSSDEDGASSFESSMYTAKRSSLSEGLRKPGLKKTTSFKNEVTTRTIQDTTSEESEEAIESDSEDESDNAIEEDDSEDDWEDDNEDSGPSSLTEREMFHKVDSKPNLVSRRSLLTTLMHEKDRASALQNEASRSTPAIRRSRTTPPNGPSTGNSPQEDSGLMMRPQASRAKPIIMTTSNVHPPMLSPRTTRRNMLQTELTQSLRQNLLWERQQKNSTTNAVNKRHQSAVSIPALRRAATANDFRNMNAVPQQPMGKASTFRDTAKNNNSYNDYFDQGLQEYHQKGW
ncbi:hypothetical protein BDV96DRAFT_598322 [Lophiotrema nucula]|uniref:Uncharacterized protein n=1 Tax=Lophiotrema nucula TaxID=690887 RepID=A0A6A5ZG81_9PLEO|nr:hypothetical protein BDV96DRAFT_598322 [Lophiotrema nucula]